MLDQRHLLSPADNDRPAARPSWPGIRTIGSLATREDGYILRLSMSRPRRRRRHAEAQVCDLSVLVRISIPAYQHLPCSAGCQAIYVQQASRSGRALANVRDNRQQTDNSTSPCISLRLCLAVAVRGIYRQQLLCPRHRAVGKAALVTRGTAAGFADKSYRSSLCRS